MNINIVEVESKVHLLSMNFSNTFFLSVANNYEVTFQNSNIVDEMHTLDSLLHDLHRKKETFIIKKDIKLITSTLESYAFLITVFKNLNNITIISPKLKRYDMIKFIQDWCNKNTDIEVKNLAKEIVEEIISPVKVTKKLTRREQLENAANEISATHKLKVLNKMLKRN